MSRSLAGTKEKRGFSKVNLSVKVHGMFQKLQSRAQTAISREMVE